MARRTITLDTHADPATTFAFLEDFSNAADWDPGVQSAQRLDTGPVALGSRFALDLLVAGRVQRWTYVVETHEAPRRVTFVTRSRSAEGVDDVTVAPGPAGGSRVTWDASFAFSGLLGRLVDPLFQVAFSRLVDKAVAGLRVALDALPADDES